MVVRGRIRAGRVELEEQLPEGAEVVVISADEADERDVFVLSAADAAELDARAEADDDAFESVEELMRRLQSHQ
ncbi:hypothetical protein [Pendulispora albinea]|uniref:Uncharacterized protein n=1 Tax=Pendulispora albinea TaxID=2741071 RepID=A0ABZ2M197_9BACT